MTVFGGSQCGTNSVRFATIAMQSHVTKMLGGTDVR